MKIDLIGGTFRGRAVLLIDEICDSGKTLQAISTRIVEEGAMEIKTVVLINRHLRGKEVKPDWAAFTDDGPEWFVGFGLDDQTRNSNLSDIYILENTGQKKTNH